MDEFDDHDSEEEERPSSSEMERFLADLDFSTSDDYAQVVEKLKLKIILKPDLEELWNETHEQTLWNFVIDQQSFVLICYFDGEKLLLSFSIPRTPVKTFFFFIKMSSEKLTSKNYDSKIIFGTANAPYFNSLYTMLRNVYFPIFEETVDWSKCIKTDYLQHQSKFFAQIFNLRNKLRGELVFFVPKSIVDLSVDEIIQNKQLLNEIERTVMDWIWMLISMLMKRRHAEFGDKGGPFEEQKFWEEKNTVLNKALEQLNREDVKKCIDILKTGKSECLPKLMEVHKQLLSEVAVASQNIQFLSILKEPCELIQEAALSDISKHLELLLNNVRIIWKHSPYFNAESQISSLLCKVNNFIIDVCSKHVPLDSIFFETNIDDEVKLLDVIFCCKLWIETFDFSKKVHDKCAEKNWPVESIAPLINLFVHRCEELIEVSGFKKLFKCDSSKTQYVTGQIGFDVAEQFEAIELYFWDLLRELSKNKNSCLDVHTTEWNDQFKKFKASVYDLEITVTKLMSNSLTNVTGIDEAIEILVMFTKYFEKEVMRRDLRRCVKTIYNVFFNEVSFVKEKIFETKKDHISYGGAAFALSLLPKKLKQQYELLNVSSHLWPEEFSVNVDDLYQQVLDAITESIQTLFLQWIKTIPKDVYGWLRCPMIAKKESTHFLEIHMDSKIKKIIEELQYWDKIGIEIPHHIVKLRQKSEVVLKRISSMKPSLKLYNRVISSLSEVSTDMFCETIKSLEESILPGLLALNWSSPHTSIKTNLKSLTEKTKSVNDMFTLYEQCNVRICDSAEQIGTKNLFLCDMNLPVELSEFIETQVNFKKEVLTEITAMFLDVITAGKKMQNEYKKQYPDDEQFSFKHMELIGKKMCSALIECFVASLKAVSTFFGISRKNKFRMVLRISLTLRENQLHFNPSFKELCHEINNLIGDMEKELSCITKSEEIIVENGTIENKFNQLVKNSDVIKREKDEIEFGLGKLHEAQEHYLQALKPFCRLWESDKTRFFSDYKAEGWKASCFEKDINEFMDIAKKIPYIRSLYALDFCISDCSGFKTQAVQCFEEWKEDIGSVFNTILCQNLQNAYDLVEITSKRFLVIPQTLKELKRCLKFLEDSMASSLEIEKTFKPIHNIFCTLVKYGIAINEKTLYQKTHLEENWKNLKSSFDNYYAELQKVQALHRRHFLEFYDNLVKEVDNFQEHLRVNGPFQLKWNFNDAVEEILRLKNCIIDFKEKEFNVQETAKFFHATIKPIDRIKVVENELENLRISWAYAIQLHDYELEWGVILLTTFNVPEKRKDIDKLKKQIIELKENVKGNHWVLLEELLWSLKQLEEYFGIILNFQEPTLQERHWNCFKEILELPPEEGISFFQSGKFCFEFIQHLQIDGLLEKTNVVAKQARKESQIEQY